jgi:hypothetical protein
MRTTWTQPAQALICEATAGTDALIGRAPKWQTLGRRLAGFVAISRRNMTSASS